MRLNDPYLEDQQDGEVAYQWSFLALGEEGGQVAFPQPSAVGWLQPDITLWGMHLSTGLLRNPWHLSIYGVLHRSYGNHGTYPC